MSTSICTVIRGDAKALAVVGRSARLVELQPEGDKTPFFMVGSFPGFIDVVALFGRQRPVLSLVVPNEIFSSGDYKIGLEAIAHVRTILKRQDRGPYLVGGCSAQGIVAYEVAQQLLSLGHEVGALILYDTPNWAFMPRIRELVSIPWDARQSTRRGTLFDWEIVRQIIGESSRTLKRALGSANVGTRPSQLFRLTSARKAAAEKYLPAPYPGRVLLFRRINGLSWRWRLLGPDFGWENCVHGKLETFTLSASAHAEIFKFKPDRLLVARELRRCFDMVEGHSHSWQNRLRGNMH